MVFVVRYKGMRVKYFLIILITIIIFLGCGGGGGGSGVGRVVVTGQISGSISFDEMLASERAIIASDSDSFRASGFNQAVVFLEELPSRAVYPDSNGNYCFTDLPFEKTFHVIARINSLTSKVYKSRSSAVLLESTRQSAVKNFYISSADEAKYQIRLQVNDTKDSPVGKCNVWLWGEEFTVDEGGCYLSPMMPLGATGKMKIVPPSNKELVTLECDIDSSTFQSEIKGVSSVTLPPYGITQKRAPYVSLRVGELLPGGSAIRIYGSAVDPQNDYLDYEWTTNVGSFTYTSFDKSYVEWAIPSEPTNAVITFKASQVSSTLYPLLYSYAELYIKISKDGKITFPGEIVIVPTQRSVDIISSATTQITGNTVAYYEANASFPNELDIYYSWNCTEGNIESGSGSRRIFWHSPLLKAYESKVATLTCFASDGIATVSKDLTINVTSFPTLTITSPIDSEFYPGEITFTGIAKDYLGNIIDSSVFEWYVATSTSDYQFILSGTASFTYNFTQKGQYSIAFNAPDISGIVGSAAKDITILNCLPVINIISPENDAGYLKNDTIVFNAEITDYEEGQITDPERVTWNSDIDNMIGSGTYFEVASLSKGMHTITVTAVDNDGGIASNAVVIWYDMPARITLTPENASVFFDNEIALSAKGVDEGNKPLDISTFKWYLDGFDWGKDGLDTFTATGLTAGLHAVKVVGKNKGSNVVSNDYLYQVGYPAPVINSPASGTRFDIGSSISFVAEPPATGSLEFNWYLDGGSNSLGSSTTFVTTLEKGRHKLEYIGIDASGKKLCGSTTVVIENTPVVSIDNVATGSLFFVTHNIEFNATADVPDSNVAWYLDSSDVPVKIGKNIVLSQAGSNIDVEAGYHIISVVATGEFGTVASASVGFTAGIEAVGITKPAGTTFAENENIEFLGKPIVDGLPLQWYLDGSPWKTTSSFNHSFSVSNTHTIRLIATDSANAASYKDITLNVGLFPIMNFVIVDADGAEVDPDNKAFFTGNDITVRGSGTDPISGNAISGRDMSWYVYDSSDNPVKVSTDGSVNSQITINASTLATLGEGIRKIELRGKANSSSDAYGSKTKQAYLNLPTLDYTEPVENQIIHLEDTKQYSQVFVASGTPNAVSPLKFEWWLNWGTSEAQKLTDVVTGLNYGSKMNLQIASGSQYLTFIGTDSAGIVSYKTKKLIISDNAAIEFTPGDGSVIFANQPFAMEVNDTVVKESIEWLLSYNGGSESPLTPRGSPYNVDDTRLSNYFSNTGYYEITASGVNSLNVPASVTNKLYYGLENAKIISIASGTRFALGSLQNFVATPTADAAYAIKAQNSSWYLDDVKQGLFDNLSSINTTFEGGYHILKYTAIDSIGHETSDSIGILFDDEPVIGLAEPVNLNNDIYVFADNVGFTLSCSGTVSVKPDENLLTNFKWYTNNDFSTFVPGQSIPGNSLNLHAGENSIIVTAEDQFMVVGTHTRTLFYGEPNAAISAPSEGQIFFNETIDLAGNTSPRIAMEWYLNGVKVGTGANYTIPIADPNIIPGVNHVTYIGTDSFGYASVDEVNFVYGDTPGLQIWLPNNTLLTENAAFFPDDLLLTGVGTSSTDVSESILPSTMKWFVDDVQMSSGASTYNVSGLTGLHKITLEGTDSNNVTGRYSVNAYFGETTPEIISPATENEHYKRNTPVESIYFEGNSLTSPISISWNLKDQSGVSTTQTSRTFSMNSDTFAPGILNVTYTGTDSAGRSKPATRKIIVANEPVISFTPGNNSAILDGNGFTLTANAVQDDVEQIGIEYIWEIGGNSVPGSNKVINIPANDSRFSGEFKNIVKLTVKDIWGISTYTTNDIYWKLPVAAIEEPANGTTYSGDYGTVHFRASLPSSIFNDAIDSGNVNYIWERKNTLGNYDDVANGIEANIALIQGANTIRLRTEDSVGNTGRSSVYLVSNFPPYVEIITPKPGDTNVCFFVNSAATFIGSATERINNTQLASSNMTWSLDDGASSTNDRYSIDKNKVTSGAHHLTFTAKDSLNTSNSVILNFKYGQVAASIISPASGTIVSQNSQIDIVANPCEAGLDEIPMQWTLTNLSTGVTTNLTTAKTANSTINHKFTEKGCFRITYIGTDSANIVSSSKIDIIVEEAPTANITNSIDQPAANNVYFPINRGYLTFKGVGTGSIEGSPISSSNLTWYLYKGTDTTTSSRQTAKGISTFNSNYSSYDDEDFYTVALFVKDRFGAVATETATFYYGQPVASITAPASGTVFDIGSTITFEAVRPNANQSASNQVPMQWFLNGVAQGSASADNYSKTLTFNNPGVYTVSYVGTDSANIASEGKICVIIENPPTVSIKTNLDNDADGAYFYQISNGNITLNSDVIHGLTVNKYSWKLYSGVDTSTAPIDSATTKNYSMTYTKLNANPGDLTAELTVTDIYGASSTEIVTFYYGLSAPDIASPSSYLRITLEAANAGIELLGNADSRLTPKWFDDSTEITTPTNFKPNAGSHIITFVATDSANVAKSDSVQIDVNDKPYISIKNTDNTDVDDSVYFILSGTESIKFVGSATAVIGLTPIGADKMTWTLYTGEGVGGTGKVIAGNSDKTVSLNSSSFSSGVGTYTIKLEALDALGFTNESVHSFYYGHVLPSIVQPVRTEFRLVEGTSGIYFEGNEDSNVHIDMTWYFDGVAGDTAKSTTKILSNNKNYTVTYKGTDSSGREKSATKNVLVNNLPEIHIQRFYNGSPDTGDTASNTFYFALSPSEQLKFQGDAKCAQDSSAIDTASLTWKLYSGTGISSSPKVTKQAVNPVVLSSSDIGNTPGTYTIALTATDKFGTSETVWAPFYYGHAVPGITSPANNMKYTTAPASVNLTAVSENPSFAAKTWQYCQGGIATSTTSASSLNLGLGTYTISLSTIDSAGVKKVAVSNIVVNKDPIVTITSPSTDSFFFGGQTLTFTGTAMKGDNATNLPVEGITWYRSTSPTGGSDKVIGEDATTIMVSAEDIGTGTWYIRMVGIDSEYPPNQTSSTYIKITTGIDVPKINSPASGTRFDLGNNIAFVGNALPSYITMSWNSDDSKLSGTGITTSSSIFTRGWRTISYSGTDSLGITHTATSMVLVDSRPNFTTNPAIVSPVSSWSGKGTATGISYPIVILPRGTMLNFKTVAKNSAVTPGEIASITWIDLTTKSVVAGSAVDPKDFLMNLTPGSYTYSIVAEDEFGVQASTTYSFWIWNCETYDGYTAAETIAANGDSNLIVASKSGTQYELKKLDRKSGSGESGTESGDISIVTSTNYNIANWTPGYSMMGFDVSNSTIYTLNGDNSSNLKLQKWKTSDLTLDGDEISFSGSSDANLTLVGDVTVSTSGSSLYVTDKTNNLVKKLSASTGALDLNSQAINNPTAIKYIDDNNIFVADTGNNRVLKMNSDCNITAVYNGVTSPSYLTYSSNSKKLYVTSTGGAKVHVIDTNTGNYLYSFGSTGTTANQPLFGTNGACDIAICGSNTLSDMYIADKVNNRIVRIRCGLTW